ncbi:MAG: hypothetical protein OEM03_13320 [Chromatiales bacterium]|nr:hypothetical protein [Chromatiales bacterium]
MRIVILLILFLLSACGGGGGSEPCCTPAGTAPRISNLSLSPDSVYYMDGDGATQISAMVDFTDPDMDITTAYIRLADGTTQTLELPPINMTSGTLMGELIVATTELGVFTSEVWLVDEAGHESNHLSVDLSVVVDVATWLNRTPAGLNTGLHDVVWNGSLFVAVGDLGKIVSSPDGITWTARTSGTTQRLNGVSWDGSRFLAVGDGGTILSSANGTSWSSLHTGPEGAWLHDVSYSGTRYVAAGSQYPANTAYMLTSVDGVTWTENATLPQNGRSISGLAWSGQLFVASAMAESFPNEAAVMVSQDGLTWVEVIVSTESPTTLCVLWDGNRFIAGGIGGRLFFSPDGMNWSQANSPSTSNFLGLASSGSTLVAAGVISNAVATSDDGATWQSFYIGSLYDTKGLAYGANRFVSVGGGEGGIIYSTR